MATHFVLDRRCCEICHIGKGLQGPAVVVVDGCDLFSKFNPTLRSCCPWEGQNAVSEGL